jgi:predicted NBD/HSP70 family sugar kinase
LIRDAEFAINEGATGPLATSVEKGQPLSPEGIALAAISGDALAVRLLQRSARVVGESIAGLVNMFNPGIIVIGGAMASAGEVYLAEVRQRVYELSLPLATRDLRILLSVNDEREPLRGGAELAREQLFEATFPRWFAQGKPGPIKTLTLS